MKKIGLVVKNDKHAGLKADDLELWLSGRGVETFRKNISFVEPCVSNRIDGHQIISGDQMGDNSDAPPRDLDCVLVLGGDGTFLSAARWIRCRRIPLMGVKFGNVGFLAESVEEDLFSAVEMVLAGKHTVQERMRLQVSISRDGEERICENALNDVVITKNALSRLAHIETCIDGQYITTYSSDGLIIATPTGSTAYSLAAGGPVIHPKVPGVILTPICPFTLTNRPLILPDTVTISMKLADDSSDMMLTIDGQEGVEIDGKDVINVTQSPDPILMIQLPTKNYFDVLKAKLMWSGGRS